MRNSARVIAVLAAAATFWLAGGETRGQSFRYGDVEFNAARTVVLVPGKAYSVIVSEFFHHGQIAADGRNLVVLAKNRQRVPSRVLQLGPGDFCRVAFQTMRGQTEYDILYGGTAPTDQPPEWTTRDGLLLETREYSDCNLQKLGAVRKAFDAAKPLGSDYVEQVGHGYNPFATKPGPFLSHYSGYLQIPSAGNYAFWTSSQDASFLLIDDKLVTSAPGRHGPLYQARPRTRGDADLSAGMHKFDYYHAAAGPTAMMAAIWEPKAGDDRRPQPERIPPEAFRAPLVGHIPAGRLTLRTAKLVPDFVFKVAGEVPLPDNPVPLLGAMFRDVSPAPLSEAPKIQWDFGDGQTATFHNVDHVYLHPGVYTVKLTIRHAGRTFEMANRIAIEPPILTQVPKGHTLKEYVKVIESYDPQKLDAAGLRQLALAYEAKALSIESKADNDKLKAEKNEGRMSDKARASSRAKRAAEDTSEPVKYFTAAVAAIEKALTNETSTLEGDEDLTRLAQHVGPIARDTLSDSQAAIKIWQGAARLVKNPSLRAVCELEAADIAVNDLLDVAAAKRLIESATGRLGATATGPSAARLQQVRGDCAAAAAGDGKTAAAAYQEAQRLLGSSGDYARQTARRGAHGRSTEEFLKDNQLDRAVAEIRAWQRDFPADKLDGYQTLLYARYWAARKQFAQAVAQADRLQAANPDSPYVDQLLYLAADCELKQGRRDRALAILHSILKDHPGSPFLPQVKQAIERLEQGEKK